MIENLAQFLVRRIEKTPEKVFLEFEQQRITYEGLYRRAAQSARGFSELGIQTEDKVCVMLDNSPEYMDVWFGLTCIGAVIVPINVHLKGDGLQYILSHSECKAIVLDDSYMDRIRPCLSSLPKDVKIIIHTEKQLPDWGEYTKLKDVITHPESNLPSLDFPGTAINSILYTSGTTGPPKGVMLSHAAYVHSAKEFAERMVGVRKDDILFTTLPLFHINAQAHTVLGGIHANATIALSKKFSASRFWDEVRFHHATIFNALGSMIPILCKQPEQENDQDNPARIAACAATPEKFWKPFEERFKIKIVEGYGLTETTGFCVSNPIHEGRIPSIGKPFPFAEAKIADENGKRLQIGEIGEIFIRSLQKHAFMEGYYKMPDKTEEALLDGWFRTGDLGYEDEEGYMYFCDRLKQCIRRRGENISSWEVEKVINAHPKVLESAAVGVPSEIGEEDVKVYVILREGETLPYVELIKWCEDRMAYFMVPRYIQYVDSFPKTATERVQKFKLKEEGIGDAWDREKALGRIRKK
ncbi:ATP-dependent acyl-CoA ligase [Siminovitchia sp. 179-K 8D1 HS]|uniref:ATP-dependent acyl-CoA ligase n=1 Tax=Siminovitchia sp. 179-K 8D1 HS TaxID=3142385 RepID=UPI0039A1CF71